MIGLVLLALLAVYWLLQTVAAAMCCWPSVVARLPVGASFTWDKVDGPVAGPLTLYNVDFRYDDIHFHAERAHLEPDLRPLLGRKLLLDKLELTNATLNLAKSDEPFKLPSWPDSLPQIEMPLAIQADAIAIDGFRISQANEPVIDISRVRGGIEIANGEFQAHKLVVDSDMGNFTAQGRYIPAEDYDTDVTVTAVLASTAWAHRRYGGPGRTWRPVAHGSGRSRARAEAAARDAGVRWPHRPELERQHPQRRAGSGAVVASIGELGDCAVVAGLHRRRQGRQCQPARQGEAGRPGAGTGTVGGVAAGPGAEGLTRCW